MNVRDYVNRFLDIQHIKNTSHLNDVIIIDCEEDIYFYTDVTYEIQSKRKLKYIEDISIFLKEDSKENKKIVQASEKIKNYLKKMGENACMQKEKK